MWHSNVSQPEIKCDTLMCHPPIVSYRKSDKIIYLTSDAELEILNADCSGLSAFEVPYIFKKFTFFKNLRFFKKLYVLWI